MHIAVSSAVKHDTAMSVKNFQGIIRTICDLASSNLPDTTSIDASFVPELEASIVLWVVHFLENQCRRIA
jgi:hypothetical protein